MVAPLPILLIVKQIYEQHWSTIAELPRRRFRILLGGSHLRMGENQFDSIYRIMRNTGKFGNLLTGFFGPDRLSQNSAEAISACRFYGLLRRLVADFLIAMQSRP